ncbi:hypothetical protein ABFU65_20210 [Xanthomonas campestris pv. raphani]|uniref:hypothetical protein n=1 Tax=Xanthomonas campestris TaxID=339 RepID=UPI0025A2152E|nr:hypothetical protein [Xanthomonas campestris]MDM7673553.1 hypothetical protein [Xanthomonas campestris pv. campestris]MEA9653336.1 hypothetical protein [Xanthomonas campestris pv. raphani]
MKIRFVLTGEGASDLNLVDHIETLLVNAGFSEVSGTPFDPSRLPFHVGHSVKEKLLAVRDLYPSADVIFVHRDADSKGLKARRQEIQDACVGIFDPEAVIPVVPVKMLETWLLVDMTAISRVAGKASYGEIGCVPAIKALENVVDSKRLLLDALCECSELQGIRLKKFKNLFGKMRARLVSAIDAEGPICQLPSYAQFKADVNSLYRKRSLKEG